MHTVYNSMKKIWIYQKEINITTKKILVSLLVRSLWPPRSFQMPVLFLSKKQTLECHPTSLQELWHPLLPCWMQCHIIPVSCSHPTEKLLRLFCLNLSIPGLNEIWHVCQAMYVCLLLLFQLSLEEIVQHSGKDVRAAGLWGAWAHHSQEAEWRGMLASSSPVPFRMGLHFPDNLS